MISIVNITKKEVFDKAIHSYVLSINKQVILKFRHMRSEPLSVILSKASKAAKKHEEEELLRDLESFAVNQTEVGSLSHFYKGNKDSYKNNYKNFEKSQKVQRAKRSKEKCNE